MVGGRLVALVLVLVLVLALAPPALSQDPPQHLSVVPEARPAQAQQAQQAVQPRVVAASQVAHASTVLTGLTLNKDFFVPALLFLLYAWRSNLLLLVPLMGAIFYAQSHGKLFV